MRVTSSVAIIIQGNEQLIINFNASIAASQLDVFCYTQSVLEQGSNYVKIYNL